MHIAEVDYKTQPKLDGTPKLGYRVDIHLTTTCLKSAKWLVATFGGVYYATSHSNPNWKDFYRWVPKGKANKEELLLSMLPYLIIKRDIALVALEFLRLDGQCPEERKRLCAKARLLTRRGKSLETNTLGSEQSEKIESDLMGDHESAFAVMQIA